MSRFAEHCAKQAEACATLGSPFTAQLCRLLGANLEAGHKVADRLLEWDAIAPDAVALRIAGGLHALVMRYPDSALADAYPPNVVDDARLWRAVAAALHSHEAFFLDWLESPPQTNEIRRCCGLIPAFHWLSARFNLPLRLSEIGASAGLNLNWDRYQLTIQGQIWGPKTSAVELAPDWRGEMPPNCTPVIAGKAGCDLNPLDPNNPAHRDRLHAYIWPDQPARHAATRAALAMSEATPHKEDALAFIARRLTAAAPDELHVIYHSIVWQYLPKPAQDACAALINEAGARATEAAPLAWLSIEADSTPGSALMHCRIWPGNTAYTLGRIDFHGRWVDWQPVRIPA